MSTSRSPSRSARSGSSHPSEASPHSEPRQVVPVAQYRSHKLEPIILQPKIPRPRSAGRGRGTRGALDLQLPAVGGEAPRPPRAEAEPAIRSAREPRAGGAIQSSPPPAPPDRGRGMDTSASRATRKRPPGEHRPLQVGDLPTSATALDPTTGAACHAPPPIPREEVVSEASPSSRSPASHLTRNRSQRSSNRARLSSPGSPESRMTSTKREGSAPSASHASIAYAKQGISAPPKNRTAKYGGVKKGKAKVTVPPAAFMCLSRVAAGIREMNWTKMYKALEILARFLIPCEAVTLYLVEEGGRYLRRVNSFLDAFPPERRGPSLQPVSESTLQGACAMKAEPCGLPVRARTVTKAQVEWASSEAMGLYPVPSKGTFHDLSAGGAPESDESMPTVSKVRNVLAFPLCFGSPSEEDPFGDYASVDSEHALADPRVFGVLKMTNRLSRGRAAQLHLTSAKDRAETKYQPFGKRDTELLECLNEFLREVYFSIDPVTFGPRDERSLDVREEFEPLNAPSLMSGTSQPSRSHQSGKLTHQQSGSRLLSHVKSGGSAVSMAAGMFGILGNAFAKGTAQRRAELPDLVQRPEVRVTSDSTEAMRAAPGWVYKEWTDEDMDFLGADHVTAQRRIGGITLLATWCLKDVKVDPFCVICRFQIRVARTSRLGPSEQAVWKEAQPFFCVSADEGQNQLVSAFLSDFLRYGEEYIVSVRAGSADRWSEWSAPSEPKRLKACDLEPANVHMRCEFLHQEPAMEAFGVQDHVLHVAFPAFGTFDSRSPLPVEYCIEAWQRPDVLGAASTEELHAYARSLDQPSRIPGAGPEWLNATPIFVTTVKSDQVQGKIIECEVDLRKTPLVPLSQVYFSVKARYLSLPLETNFSPKYCWSQLMLVPELLTALPSPEPFLSTEFLPDAQGGGLGSMVLRWPFRHPAHFCEMESGDWHKGPFVPKALPGEFPLPFRVQCRVLRAASAGEPPRWSEWREVGAYKFVKRQTPQRHPSQRVAGRWASQGQFPSKSEGGSEFAAEEECFDPSQDPLGIMSEWALLVTGVGSEESPWSGLTQLRWVSCTVEGAVSAPSETLCTRIAPPCEPPEVEHLVVNCSSSNVTGRRDQIDEEAPVLEEQVVYELRHVARLSWQLDAGAPSFSFLHFFQIHYKEVPPDKDEKELEWQHLPLTPLQEAADNTNLDEALTTEQRARFSFEVTSIPLLRFHRYRFAVQVLSHEHASAWSRPSRPLHLVLPEVLPPKALEEASTEEGSEEEYAEHREENEKSRPGREEEDEAKEETGRRKHEGKEEEDHAEENEECGEARRQKDEAAEDEEEGTVEETGRRKPKEKEEEDHAEGNEESQTGRRQEDRVACKKGKPGRVKLFDAEIQCQGEDASTWQVELRWRPFPRGGEAFPALDALAVEYQVSYFVLSERPCAESKESATRVGPSFVQGSQTSHYMVHQRQSATVCLEGSIAPEEQVVIRHLPRFRLPPLRCDVRLFLASRCMAITGPSWSKEALYVDLCLPRQVALPLPVPEQLSCLALLRHGIQMDIGTHPGAEPQPEGLWAVLKIEKFPREFVLDSHSQVGDDDLLELGSPAPKAHYILQYRCYDPDVPFSSASACPLVEEKYWREVPIIKPLDGGEDRVFLAAGLDSGALTKTKEHCWAKFRLASRVWSHFSFASLAAPVSPLQPPARPELSVEWVDSPSLDGLRIRVSAPCDMLSQAYQLRFRLSKDSSKSAWQLCDLVPMKLEALGQEGLSVEALAPTDQLHYHSEYHFSIRTCSLFRFSPWSEDSTAFRISLEHEGMCQDECGVEVEIYGQEERHNCRCPVADVSWAPLALPKAVDLTIEYRLRWRRRLPAYNDAVALYAAMDELRSIHDQGDEWQGRREEASGGVRPVRLMVPDPDEQLQDIANRGYLGDCTKRFHGLPEFSPWQLAAVVRAKVGPQSVKRCSYALTFLQSGADYEVQVDWRWQRLGDSFWMPAYPAKRFHMPSAPQQPPLLRPLRILPEVLDGHEQLQSLCNLCQQEGQRLGRGFGLFEWPFEQPPALAQMLALAPTGSQLTEEWRRDPGLYGTFTVQCRRQSWVLCQVALLEISGKAACFVFAPPEQPLEDQRTADATDEPKPTPLPEMPQLEDGDMEFRVLRTNDCEVSEVLTYPALPLEPPVDVQCRLKMTGPQSAFGVAICFRGLPSPGFASAPEEYQIRMQEMQGSEVVKEEVLPPRRLPMNRVAEAFPDALQRPDFLGQARSLECAVRSGGQPERRLEELEFEHFLTDVIYGKTYHIAVRWMSKFKVSPWSAVAKSDVSFPPPTTAEEVLSVKLLPDATMSAELAGKDFSPPALWHRFQLTWQPFMASLWGSRMEYRLERRSLLHDRRTSPEGILPELDSAELETSPWELIGQVMADIDDASGKGCYQLQSRRKGHTKEELLQSFHAKDGRPRDEQLDGLFGRRSETVELSPCYDGETCYHLQIVPRIESGEQDESVVLPRKIARTVLDMVYTSHVDQFYGDTSFARMRLARALCRTVYAGVGGASDETQDEPAGAPKTARPVPNELVFPVEELQPSVTYQFRLFTRLHFHPAFDQEGEWSAPLLSAWHRTPEAVPPPPAPREAVVPDPPPLELLEEGSVLLIFDELPIREPKRPEPAPGNDKPAPFQLQFRGALEPVTADWQLAESKPLDGDQQKIVVKDSRLSQFAEDGVIFRLWRPQMNLGDSHRVEDDARVRHFGSLSSVSSNAIRPHCANFDEWPKATLVLQASADLRQGMEDPPPTAMLRLDWKVHVPSNSALLAVRLHQVRFRRVQPLGKDDNWQELIPFECHIAVDKAWVRREIPLVGPNFLFGADYEVCVRMGTDLRWGNWSPPEKVSLAIHPPQPPREGVLQLEDVHLPDGATFFRLTWPAFDTHPLCNLIEYRIRMQRVSHFRYMERLSEEILARAQESFAAQEEAHLVGTIRVRVPQTCGPAKGFGAPYKDSQRESLEFVHRVAGDAECGYRFFVDAKHEHYRQVDGQQDSFLKFAGEQEDWSVALESRESVVPPMPRNTFVPEQVPVDADPDADQLRAAFPLKLEEYAVDRLLLAEPSSQRLVLFAPWQVAKEASRWPHRVEYSPYLPDVNGGRLPIPGDMSEDKVDWHLPITVEYLWEAQSERPLARGPEECCFVLAKGFDESLWETEMARLDLHRDQMKALGLFARVRVVREGGPEGMQLLSSPSRPLRLYMPPVDDLKVTVWSTNGRFCALLWWPSIVAACAEIDKNLDMSGQLHQVRLRRPDYEHDAGWVQGQVKRTLPPVSIQRSTGAYAPHTFDLCSLLDDSIVQEELLNEALPKQPYGAFRNPRQLTYEFSVRVSDGYRWSDWSASSARCCFAVEPKIVTTAPVELNELHQLLTGKSDVVSAAHSVDLTKPLTDQLTFLQDGEMEPPRWVTISKKPPESTALAETARLSQFVASWPNLPPAAYSQPETTILTAAHKILETGSLPPFVTPPLLYRINVWLVGVSPDAADVDVDVRTVGDDNKDLLYRQYDVPPSSYPVDKSDQQSVKELSWILPSLLPDKIFRCTLEARFETNTSVNWWTPLMESGPFVVERVPPPAPPELLPVAELPTPEQQKLLTRLAPGSRASITLRWPWCVEGRHTDLLKESSHVLEFCRSAAHQTFRDPSGVPVNTLGETAFSGRPLGPWREAKALQLCFANFVKNEVLFELSEEAISEPNWVPALVASGLWDAEGEDEPESVHLRWRYRAGLSELATTNSTLHFSASSGPVRTIITMPSTVSLHLEVPERASRLAGWLQWKAWQGSEKHQFSYRILSKQKKKRHLRGSLLSESESTDTLDEAMLSTPRSEAGNHHAVTGWIEMPPVFDNIKRHIEAEVDHEDLLLQGEASQLADFERKLSGTEWQHILWRHYHTKQEEFWDPARLYGESESSWQFSSSLNAGASTMSDTARSSLGSTKTRDVPFRIRPSHLLEWRVRVSDGLRWSEWSAPSPASQLAPPIPSLAGPVRLIFNRREPTVAKVVWSGCETLIENEHLMQSIEYLVFMSIDENSGRELIQDEGSFDVERLHNWGVHLSDGSCGRLLPHVGKEGEAVPAFDFESLFSEDSQKRLLGKFRHREMRTVSAEGDGGPPTVQGFELHVSGLKPHCMHCISVCVRCAVENLPEPDWQRLKLDPSHPMRWSEPFHSSPLLTPLRPPPMLVPELVPVPDGRFGRFLHTPCILLKCAMFAKQNKNDSDKDHSVVVDCRPAGSTDEDYRLVQHSIYCEPVEHGPCRLVYNLPFLHAEIRTRNITMNDVSAASIPFFAVPPLTIQDCQGPKVQMVVGKEGTLCVRLEWTSRCLPAQKPKLLQIGVRRHAVDQVCAEHASHSILPEMCLEELFTSALCTGKDFEELMQAAESRYQDQGGVLRDQSPYYCRHCFQPFQRKVSDDLPNIGPLGEAWIREVPDVLRLSAVAVEEIGPGNRVDIAALRAPHCIELDHHMREDANPWEAIRKAKTPCGCRDIFCRKDMHVDGEQLVHGTVYTFKLRVSDGHRWSAWTEYSPPMQVVIPPPRPPSRQENLVPTPPPTVEVVFVKDEDDTLQSAVEGLKGPDIRLRLRWPRFEGRMQEVEYRILMWTLTPELRKRAVAREKGLPPIVGVQSFFTSSSFPGVTAQVDESLGPRIVRPVVPDCSPVARARPRSLQSGMQDTPEIIAHIQPLDPAERGFKEKNELPQTLEAEVNVVAIPKSHGYVFAVEAKHCRGALGNLGEWSPPMFSRCIEFQHQSKELSLEVDARFGAMLFKGQAATQPKPKNEKVQMEANAVSFVDEHRDLPKAMPLLTNPGGDPWPIGASPKKFIMRTKGRTVYAERLDDEKIPELPEARPRKDDFREA